MTITVAIPSYNRFSMVKNAVASVIRDPRVGEVVVCDDASTDNSFSLLKEWECFEPKLRVFQNRVNLDCYANKAEALRHATNPWCILLDSDNKIGIDYLDTLFSLPAWRSEEAYLPTFAKPHFDYRQFEGQVITSSNVARFMDNARFRCALNTANYFVNKHVYLALFNPNINPHTSDSIYMNYRYLQADGALVFVTGLQYEHLVHAGSHYKLNNHKTGKFAHTVEAKLRALK